MRLFHIILRFHADCTEFSLGINDLHWEKQESTLKIWFSMGCSEFSTVMTFPQLEHYGFCSIYSVSRAWKRIYRLEAEFRSIAPVKNVETLAQSLNEREGRVEGGDGLVLQRPRWNVEPNSEDSAATMPAILGSDAQRSSSLAQQPTLRAEMLPFWRGLSAAIRRPARRIPASGCLVRRAGRFRVSRRRHMCHAADATAPCLLRRRRSPRWPMMVVAVGCCGPA